MADICLTLAADTPGGLQKKIERYDGHVPLAEIRLDFLDRVVFPELPGRSSTRYLATCRPVREGGRYAGPESERLEILGRAGDHGFSLVDLEYDVADNLEFSSPVEIVRSHHDFRGCPDDLGSLYREMSRLPGDLVKLVVTPRDTSTLLKLLGFMEDTLCRVPGVILGMGDAARVTRVLGPFLGSPWTYVSEGESGVAPGQFSLDLAVNSYRLAEWRDIPRLYAVGCGNPEKGIDELVNSLNAGLRIVGAGSLVLPFPGMDGASFIPYYESSRLPYRGFIELDAGEGWKIRRFSLDKGAVREVTVDYRNSAELVTENVDFCRD